MVALGDSAAAGDGAGGYQAGTRGEGGNWCHRSARAYVHRTGLAAESVNLACSGAAAADVGFGARGHYTEGSQAARLVEVARRYRVDTVVLQVGANDDAALVATGIACIAAFLDPAAPAVPGDHRPAAAASGWPAPRRAVQAAVRRRAGGHAPGRLRRGRLRAGARLLRGPGHRADGAGGGRPGLPVHRGRTPAWGRTVLFPALSAALRGVAERTGARFLDLTRATEGREACSRPTAGQEWQRRITVDPTAFVHGGLDAAGYHLAQESFHPNAAAHAELGRCLGEFVRSGDRGGSVRAGNRRAAADGPRGGAAAPA